MKRPKWHLTEEEAEKLKPQDRIMRGIKLSYNENTSGTIITLLQFLAVMCIIATMSMFLWILLQEIGIKQKLVLLFPMVIILLIILILGVLSLNKKVKQDKRIETEYKEKVK